jgi:Family of unknown function (DUF5819)
MVEAQLMTVRAAFDAREDATPLRTAPDDVSPLPTAPASGPPPAAPTPGAAWTIAAVALPVAVLAHFGLVMIVIAVPWTIPRSAQPIVEAYLVPFFIQDWRLFAPRPDIYDYAVFARGEYRVGEQLDRTPGLDLIEPTLTAVQANRLSPASTRLEIVHKAALFTIRAAGPLGELGIGREAVAERWATVEQQPASLIVLERLASAALADRYVGTPFETVQVMVTARPVGADEAAGVGAGVSALLFRPVPFQDVRVR